MKINARLIAKHMCKVTDKNVTFVERCEKGYHFQVQQWKTYTYMDIKGVTTQSYISDEWVKHSYEIYGLVTCFPIQCGNGDLEYMINNGLTQDLNFKYED